MMNRINFYLIAAVLVFSAALAPTAAAQQPQAGQTFRIAKIEFVGLQRWKSDEVIATSGLTVGQMVDEAALDKAAETLVGSGLFKTLSYRFHGTGDQFVVTFTVVEATVRLPVVFDNFIWFTDDELITAVRHEVPIFDGTAPESGDTVDSIKRALMNLLRQKKIAGSVEYLPALSPGSQGLRFVYKGDALNVCSINFPGAAEIEASALQHQLRSLVGQEYSRAHVLDVARETLGPIYRKRGMLKIAFSPPTGKPGSGECANGVAVTIPVDEGAVYHWSNIDWSGNAVLEGPELTHALDMKPGEVADGLKIESGFAAVRAAYGKRGYLTVHLAPTPEFDDEKKVVGYHTGVTEGPQFLMGNLIITGLPAEETARLKAKWKLQPGDVYDDSYLAPFMKANVATDQELQAFVRKDNLVKIESAIKPDAEKRTVAVSISFARP